MRSLSWILVVGIMTEVRSTKSFIILLLAVMAMSGCCGEVKSPSKEFTKASTSATDEKANKEEAKRWIKALEDKKDQIRRGELHAATATVKYIEHKTAITLFIEMFNDSTAEPIVTQCGIIRSLAVAERVVRKLKLIDLGASEEEANRAAASLIQDNISTKIIPNTDVIEIKVIHTDPELAAKIANTTAESYMEVNLEKKLSEVRWFKENTKQRLDKLAEMLKRSKKDLSKLKSEFGLTGEAQSAYSLLQDLKKDRQTLEENNPNLKRLDEQIASLQEELKQYPESEIKLASIYHELNLETSIYSELKQRLVRAEIEDEEAISDITLIRPARPESLSPDKVGYRDGYKMGIVDRNYGVSFYEGQIKGVNAPNAFAEIRYKRGTNEFGRYINGFKKGYFGGFRGSK